MNDKVSHMVLKEEIFNTSSLVIFSTFHSIANSRNIWFLPLIKLYLPATVDYDLKMCFAYCYFILVLVFFFASSDSSVFTLTLTHRGRIW